MSNMNLKDYTIHVFAKQLAEMPPYLSAKQFENVLLGYDPSLQIDSMVAKKLLAELEHDRIIIPLAQSNEHLFRFTEEFVAASCVGSLKKVQLEMLKKIF